MMHAYNNIPSSIVFGGVTMVIGGYVQLRKRQTAVLKAQWYCRGYIGSILGQALSLLRRNVPVVANHVGPGPGNTFITCEWLTKTLTRSGGIGKGETITSVIVSSLSDNRGMVGDVKRITVRIGSGNTKEKSFIMKSSHPDAYSRAWVICNRMYREALFYESNWAKTVELKEHLPETYYQSHSKVFGSFIIIQEDLSRTHTGANLLLGNQIWGVDAKVGHTDEKTKIETIERIIEFSVKLHSLGCKLEKELTLVDGAFKSVGWLRGEDQVLWDFYYGNASQRWRRVQRNLSTSMQGIEMRLNSKLLAAMDRSLRSATFEGMQAWMKSDSFHMTLAHGDFHAANIMVRTETVRNTGEKNSAENANQFDVKQLKMLDWQEVGPWTLSAEVGQMLVSDVTPALRRKLVGGKTAKMNPKNIIRTHYWSKITNNGQYGDKRYTWEECWNDFVVGTLAKWFSMFLILADFEKFKLPVVAVQYFHDQVSSFFDDYVENKDDILIPWYPLGMLRN